MRYFAQVHPKEAGIPWDGLKKEGIRSQGKERITCSSKAPRSPRRAAGLARPHRQSPQWCRAPALGRRGAVPTIASLGADIAPQCSQWHICGWRRNTSQPETPGTWYLQTPIHRISLPSPFWIQLWEPVMRAKSAVWFTRQRLSPLLCLSSGNGELVTCVLPPYGITERWWKVNSQETPFLNQHRVSLP